MSLDTFANLKTAIADHLGRSDLTSYIPDFITLAEARHKREIRIREMVTRSAITVNARQISLPTGFLEAKTFRLLTSPVTVLKPTNFDYMNQVRDETSGKPSYFVISNEIEFDKTPDSSYSGEIVYYKAFTALSDGATSNSLLTRAPDAYLYGALVASAPFLLDDARIQVWNNLYNLAVEGLAHANRQEGHVGPMISRPHGATP